jgi:hypothetical protein
VLSIAAHLTSYTTLLALAALLALATATVVWGQSSRVLRETGG